jgi:hypothetical protein
VAASIVNSGDFGEVCGGTQSNLAINILNQGTCDLVVNNIASDNGSFLAPTTISYPVTLSHDASLQFPVSFKPTGTCSDTNTLTGNFTISSNATPSTTQVSVSGKQPCPHLNFNPTALTGPNAFPPTVTDTQNLLGCYSDKQVTLSNAGKCSLSISNVSASSALGGFTVVNPTSYPLTIAPGGGTQQVTVRFKPISLTGQVNNAPDDQTGTLTITSNDPNAAGTAGLCGEPTVKSGIRVLVTNTANVPVPSVDNLGLSSKGLVPVVNFTLKPALLRTGSACGNTITYHMDNETLVPVGTTGSNPKASYSVNAKVHSSQANQSFSLGQCEVKQFVLQTK